jgi:hypothetical protein
MATGDGRRATDVLKLEAHHPSNLHPTRIQLTLPFPKVPFLIYHPTVPIRLRLPTCPLMYRYMDMSLALPGSSISPR